MAQHSKLQNCMSTLLLCTPVQKLQLLGTDHESVTAEVPYLLDWNGALEWSARAVFL